MAMELPGHGNKAPPPLRSETDLFPINDLMKNGIRFFLNSIDGRQTSPRVSGRERIDVFPGPRISHCFQRVEEDSRRFHCWIIRWQLHTGNVKGDFQSTDQRSCPSKLFSPLANSSKLSANSVLLLPPWLPAFLKFVLFKK